MSPVGEHNPRHVLPHSGPAPVDRSLGCELLPPWAPVPCQNSFRGAGQALWTGWAAVRYSVIKPPGICLRAIGVVISTAWPGSRRRFLLQALVRAVPVIVPGVPGQ